MKERIKELNKRMDKAGEAQLAFIRYVDEIISEESKEDAKKILTAMNKRLKDDSENLKKENEIQRLQRKAQIFMISK